MKIVILRLNVADFGKIGTYNVQETGLASALIKKGHDVKVLYLNRQTKNIIQDENYRYVYYLPHKSFGIHGIFKTSILNEFNPDEIILFSDNQFWAREVILWCKKNRIKCIHYFGNVLSDNKRWINQLYTRLILERNRKSYNYSINVAKTKKVENEMKLLKVPFKKVINVGLDTSILNESKNLDRTVRKELGFSEDEIVILFIGRLIEYKKPLLACDILKEMKDRGLKSRLIIIGKGKLEEEVKKYIEYNDLEKDITFLRRIPYTEIYKYMVGCDCCINLSAQEIFGMTVLEAMYYGLPIVAHIAPGPNEIIENNISGYLVDFDDKKKWVDKILEAVKNRKELAINSRKRIENKFTWDKIAEEFLKL